MSDEGLDGVWGEEGMSADDVKIGVEGSLCPKGRWEGQLEPVNYDTVKAVETEGGAHPLEGKKVARLHAKLFTEEGEKHFFFDAYPAIVKAVSKSGGEYLRRESQHAAHLYKATKLVGRPFKEVLAAAADTRLVFDIGIRKEREDKETGETYPAENTLRGIYAVGKEV